MLQTLFIQSVVIPTLFYLFISLFLYDHWVCSHAKKGLSHIRNCPNFLLVPVHLKILYIWFIQNFLFWNGMIDMSLNYFLHFSTTNDVYYFSWDHLWNNSAFTNWCKMHLSSYTLSLLIACIYFCSVGLPVYSCLRVLTTSVRICKSLSTHCPIFS